MENKEQPSNPVDNLSTIKWMPHHEDSSDPLQFELLKIQEQLQLCDERFESKRRSLLAEFEREMKAIKRKYDILIQEFEMPDLQNFEDNSSGDEYFQPEENLCRQRGWGSKQVHSHLPLTLWFPHSCFFPLLCLLGSSSSPPPPMAGSLPLAVPIALCYLAARWDFLLPVLFPAACWDSLLAGSVPGCVSRGLLADFPVTFLFSVQYLWAICGVFWHSSSP
ncbi:hypothetical protein MA16_Dca021336 [Dendrobium catenatum]|uniref:Uncharacterized protein n=1 Tax=Dendrobium catenatum TaxID=906689 RepID=A0A2I0WWY9_9ASPA|nr:hypothetical protein MA16_Dca021336 [Dendrobium catenatum]